MLNKEQQLYPIYFSQQIVFQYQLRHSLAVFNELSNISAKTLLLMSVCLDLNNTNYQTHSIGLNNNSKRNLKKLNSVNLYSNRPSYTTAVSATDNWFVASFADFTTNCSYQSTEKRAGVLLDSIKSYSSTKTTLDNMTQSSSLKQPRPASEETTSLTHFHKDTKIRDDKVDSGMTSVDMSNNHSIADEFVPSVRDNLETRGDVINSADLVVEVPTINQGIHSSITQVDIDADSIREVGSELYHDSNVAERFSVVSEGGDSQDNLDQNDSFTVVVESQEHINNEVEDIVEIDINIVEERGETVLPKNEAAPIFMNYESLQESAEDLAQPVIPPIENVKKQQVFSPMPGKIVNICVHKGQAVAKGELLMVMEMMKMHLSISASCDAIITDIFVEVGGDLFSGQELFGLTEHDPI